MKRGVASSNRVLRTCLVHVALCLNTHRSPYSLRSREGYRRFQTRTIHEPRISLQNNVLKPSSEMKMVDLFTRAE